MPANVLNPFQFIEDESTWDVILQRSEPLIGLCAWSVDNPAILEIVGMPEGLHNEKVLVKGKTSGVTSLHAAVDGETYDCQVTVGPEQVPTVTFLWAPHQAP